MYYLTGLTLHPVSPLPIVKLLFLVGIVYVMEKHLQWFPSLLGDLCLVIPVVQPKYNLLFMPWFPFGLQREDLFIL